MGASSSNSRFHDEMITTTIMSSHHLNQICAQCGIFVHTQTRAQFAIFAGVHLSLAPGCYTLSATIAAIWYSDFFDVWYVNIYSHMYTGYTVFIAQRKRTAKITRHPYSITLIFEYGWWMGLIYNLILPEEILRLIITLSIQRFVFICITFR